MRVLVVPQSGGVRHVGENVSAELERRGHSVSVVHVTDGSAWTAFAQAWRLRSLLRGCASVHAELGRTTEGVFWFVVSVLIVAPRTDVRVVLHDAPISVREPGAALAVRGPGWRDVVAYRLVSPPTSQLAERFLRSRVRHTVVLSRRAARDVRTAGWPSVSVVSHGSAAPTAEVPPSAGGYVLLAGYLGPGKGLDVLADAWQRVNTALPLIIAGAPAPHDAAWVADIRARFDAGRNAPKWLGSVSDERFAHLIADAAVVVIPYETSNPASGVLIRALVEGRAVVATDVPAVEDEIADGIHGLVARCGDAAHLAEKIQAVIDDEGLRDALGQAARARAAVRHTWAGHVTAMESVDRVREAP